MVNNINIDEICPINETLDLFSRKWAICVITDMFLGKKHFTEFKENNPGMSNYILSTTLKFLEENNLINKITIDNNITEYNLTEKGLKLNKILYEMALYSLSELRCSKFSEEFKEKIHDKYKKALIKN